MEKGVILWLVCTKRSKQHALMFIALLQRHLSQIQTIILVLITKTNVKQIIALKT